MSIYGYFDQADQLTPAHDPGLAVDCPVCHMPLARPVATTSLMVPGDVRSYFYRMHKACRDGLTEQQETNIDSILIDAIASTGMVN